jgi:hypothetical protein
VQLTENFSRREFERSGAATRRNLPNVMDERVLKNYRSLAIEVLQPLRDTIVERGLGRFIWINSGYRQPLVNSVVGGVRGSHHTAPNGLAAADIEVPGLWNASLAAMILELGLPFHELILEYPSPTDPAAGWVHVSHDRLGNNPREMFTKTHRGLERGINAPGTS